MAGTTSDSSFTPTHPAGYVIGKPEAIPVQLHPDTLGALAMAPCRQCSVWVQSMQTEAGLQHVTLGFTLITVNCDLSMVPERSSDKRAEELRKVVQTS